MEKKGKKQNVQKPNAPSVGFCKLYIIILLKKNILIYNNIYTYFFLYFNYYFIFLKY